MEIVNIARKRTVKRSNHKLLPKSIRGLIVGESGCGKTVLLFNLLFQGGWLDYDKLYVFSKSLFQPEYVFIKRCFEKNLSKDEIWSMLNSEHDFEELEKVLDGVDEREDNGFDLEMYADEEDVPAPDVLDKDRNNLMIFDDLCGERQSRCEQYYTHGRHSNVDVFYLSQNYFKLPRQTIRANSNLMILFPLDERDMNHIHSAHGAGVSREDFKIVSTESWKDERSFMVIDKSRPVNDGRLRKRFTTFACVI